jgi:hypothetical protein
MSDTSTPTAPAAEGNTPEPKYCTRYGITTASDAALDLLDRAHFRADFLSTMFEACIHTGITIPDYEVCGLASILKDIGYDIQTAYNYYYGDDDTPGQVGNALEVKP